MIIDLILDRKDGHPYQPDQFYRDCMEYSSIFDGIGADICEAMDYGTEDDVRKALCAYITCNDYNPAICDYINSVCWLDESSDDEAALRDWELSAIETGNYLINDADEIVRVLVITRIDGELSFHCETRTGARIDVDAAQASRCKVVTDDSSWEDKRLAAGLWSGRPAGHATYYVVESDGDYITATVNFSQACYESREEYQRRRARAFFRTVAERYAFSDCSDDHVLEIVYDGCRIEYAGWRPGMRYTFYEPTTGLVAYDESFPEWDH